MLRHFMCIISQRDLNFGHACRSFALVKLFHEPRSGTLTLRLAFHGCDRVVKVLTSNPVNCLPLTAVGWSNEAASDSRFAKAIQLGYRMPIWVWNNVQRGTWGLPSPVKLEVAIWPILRWCDVKPNQKDSNTEISLLNIGLNSKWMIQNKSHEFFYCNFIIFLHRILHT
jgi:hypothetical protein